MDYVLINVVDLFLVPLYFFILYFIIVFIKNKNPENFLIQKYLVKGFCVKMAGGVIYALLVYYYWQGGDTQSYFKETLEFRQLIFEDKVNLYQVLFYDYSYFENLFNLKSGATESSFAVIKFSVLLSYFTFSSFLATTMLMGTIAYAGIFKLFETFVSYTPKWHIFVAWIVLFFPSLNLYGSGILKDTICFSSLAWIFHCTNNLLVKKKLYIGQSIIIVFCIYLILVIKPYIIACYLAIYIIFLGVRFLKKIKNKFVKTITFPLVVVLLMSSYIILSPTINKAIGAYSTDALQQNMEGLQKSYGNLTTEVAGSNFEIGPMEFTTLGIIKKLPIGIIATLYRPFLWEVRKLFVFFSSLESLFILLFTLFVFIKAGYKYTFKSLFNEPMVFLCIFFSLVFSGMVGLSTLNFGTLARYRIPVIPFYLMGFLLILYNSKIRVVQTLKII